MLSERLDPVSAQVYAAGIGAPSDQWALSQVYPSLLGSLHVGSSLHELGPVI
jgi:hypothetical protein